MSITLVQRIPLEQNLDTYLETREAVLEGRDLKGKEQCEGGENTVGVAGALEWMIGWEG
jgi:hypothetical protein